MTAVQTLDIRVHINGRKMSGTQWLLLVLCFLIVATDGIDVAIMGFLAPAITKDWGISRAAFGLVMSAAPVGLAAGALMIGPLSDRYGRKTMLLLSIALFGAFSVLSALATDVLSLCVLRFLTGLGLGAAMPNTTTLLSEYVPEARRSTLIAIMFTGFNLGSGLGGFGTALILPHYGWRGVLVAGGLIPLACLPLYMLLVPESARFMVVRKYAAERIARTLRRVCGGEFGDHTRFVVSEPPVQDAAPGKVLVSPSYRGITMALWTTYFMGLLVIYLLSGWLPTLIKDAGLPIERAANMGAMFQVGGTIGAVLVGILMDRWTPKRAIAAAYAAGAAFILVLAMSSVSSALFSLYVFMTGFCMSGAQTGLNAFAPSCYPTAVRATGVSWMLGVGRFGSILGSFLGGLLLTMGWSFAAVIGILAVPAMFAALSIVASRSAARTALA